jgi:hypothetical protein
MWRMRVLQIGTQGQTDTDNDAREMLKAHRWKKRKTFDERL